METWAKVAAVARRQHMLITSWQLLILGVSEHAVRDRIRKHGWTRRGRGVVALPGEETQLRRLASVVLAYSAPTAAADRVARLTRAGVSEVDAVVEVALDAGQAACGESALWLHDIAPRPSTHFIRLTRSQGKATRKGVVVRRGPSTGELLRIKGLPVVDVEQAFLDLAAGGDETSGIALHHHLTKLIATADRKRATTLAALERRLEATPRCAGKPALRRALADLRGELAHSATEKKARKIVATILAKYQLQLHPRPYAVVLEGRAIGEADLAVLEICLDIEIDGPHHLLPAQQETDRLRDRRMRRASWEVERFPTELVDMWPVRFAAQVEECVRFRLGL